jgi:DNA-binding CsgD family transcriptional regulator
MDIRVIIKLHNKIVLQKTGTPKELARTLEISERTLYNYVLYMKEELNAHIIYDANNKTYKYASPCKLSFEC